MSNVVEFSQPLLPGLDETTLGSELLESEISQRARYSGKIVDKNRERVETILGARAMGFPVRQICTHFHVSPHTLTELERRHSVKLATLKDRLARKFGVFVELGLDRAIAEVGKMDIDKLMISLGIATDKVQVLTGEPSVIVGNLEGSKLFSVETLRARLSPRPVIDVTPTGLAGEKIGTTREGEQPAIEVSTGPASSAPRDNQSSPDVS